MATETGIVTETFIAGADLSAEASKFLAVKIGTTADQIVVAGAGEAAIGILLEGAEAGGKCLVALCTGSGKLKAQAGGVTTIGGPITPAADGQLVNAATGNVVIGIGLEAGAAGRVISFVPLSYVAA